MSRFNRGGAASITGVCLAALIGCAHEPPTAGVGDPAVFTMLHIAAAEESAIDLSSATTRPTMGSVREDMLRYFRSDAMAYEGAHLRCDDMLDSKQSAQSTAQLVSTVLDIAGKVSVAKTPTTKPVESGGTEKKSENVDNGGEEKGEVAKKPEPSGPVLTAEDKAALASALTAAVQDSAFDRIDRAFDFYSELHLKLLTTFGHDSRTMQPKKLWEVVQHQRLIRVREQIDHARADAQAVSAQLAKLAAQKPELLTRVQNAQAALSEIETRVAFSGAKISGPGRIASAGSIDWNSVWTKEVADAKGEVDRLEREVTSLQIQAQRFDELVVKTQSDLSAMSSKLDWPKDEVKGRLLFVSFPISVEPGTLANRMCGVRIRIVDGVDDVHVVGLIPQRTYDIESEVSVDLTQRVVDIALSAAFGGAGYTGDAKYNNHEDRRSERRRNFLSRMNKQGAIVDSTHAEFGWNFYPTNLQVNDNSAIDWLKNLVTGKPNDFTVNAYVDGGVYNCGAYIVVPPELTSFSYTVEYVYARVDQDGVGGKQWRGSQTAGRGSMSSTAPEHQTTLSKRVVTLPDATGWEWEAGFKALETP